MMLAFSSSKIARWVDLGTCRTILEVYREALTGFSHIFCPDGLNHTLLSQDCILETSSHCRNVGWNVHSKDRGGVRSPPIARVQLSGHVLSMTSSNTPPLTTGSYTLTRRPLLQCALRGQQGVWLARRWLIRWLPGCTEGSYHSNSIGTYNIKHRRT